MDGFLILIIIVGICAYVGRVRNTVVLFVVLLGMYGCWKIVYPSGTFNYKLTLVVDDNGKQITGSAVRQVHIQVNPRITPETNNSISVKGEAVVIDLGERGVLFALLRSKDSVDYGYYIVFDNFPTDGAATAEGIKYYTSLKAEKFLSFDKIPMLVRFRDINDPKTVELVDPNDLEASFGAGVKLLSATLEMSDEGVTSGVEKLISKTAWKEHGYAEWRANLRYDQVIFDWEDFERK